MILRRTVPVALLLWIAAASAAPFLPEAAHENLPPLLEVAPQDAYEVLTPIGAGKKELLDARQQLRREAVKVQADAVIVLNCEEGGVTHDGMTWYRKDAYCRGLAIRYKEPRPSQK